MRGTGETEREFGPMGEWEKRGGGKEEPLRYLSKEEGMRPSLTPYFLFLPLVLS